MNSISEKIKNSKKYKGLYKKTIERIVLNCISKYGEKRAEKEAKNILHQIWGAYYSHQPNFNKILSDFKKNTDIKNTESIKENILPIIKIHSSTKERISELNEFYTKIFEITGTPNKIIDLACGLNPLTFFWMNLPRETKYLAFDIDEFEINFIQEVFSHLNIQNIKINLRDILTEDFESADIIFLLKTLQNLEQQEKGSALKVIKKLKSKYIIVSFPVKTVSGKEKGMENFYEKWFLDLIKNEGWNARKITFKTELVFIVEK